MNIRPVPGWKANVYGLRRPRAQIARLFPVAVLKNGLSVGMLPSLLIRSTFPSRVVSDWEFAPLALSPAAAYSLPSGPKWMAPPLRLDAPLSAVRSKPTVWVGGAVLAAAAGAGSG